MKTILIKNLMKLRMQIPPIILCAMMIGLGAVVYTHQNKQHHKKENSVCEKALESSTYYTPEFSLASKMQLLRAYGLDLKTKIKCAQCIQEALRDAHKDGATPSKKELKKILSTTIDYVNDLMKDGKQTLISDLQNLKNNPCVNSQAADILKLVRKDKDYIGKFDSLFGEVRSEIAILKSMEINTSTYESEIHAMIMDYFLLNVLLG